MRRVLQVGVLATLCCFAAAVFAQAPAHIELGQRVSGAAAGEGGDFYAFVGAEGTRLKAGVTLPGLGAVTLYDSNGEELVRAEGEGSATLSQTLEADDIYLLGVTRAAKGADYTLALEGQVPRIEFVYDDADPGADTGVAKAASAPASMATAGPPPFVADPAVWGVYARLAGRKTVQAEGIPFLITWVWQRPGEVLVEEYRKPNGAMAWTNIITPTGTPGELLMHPSTGKDWTGRLDAAGNVDYDCKGWLCRSFQVGMAADGSMEVRRVTIRDGVVTPLVGGQVLNYPLAPEAP